MATKKKPPTRNRKRQDSQGRWRDAKGHFTSAPKRAGRKPKPKPKTVIIYGIGQALYELRKAGVAATYAGPANVPLAPPKPKEEAKPEEKPKEEAKPEEPKEEAKPIPQSGRKKPEKVPDPLFHFRDGATHIDIEQGRPDLDAIKRWIAEWDADWHRNRNGSYQAMVSLGEDDAPEEGPDDVLDTLQTAALQVPGPALVRFGVWHRTEDVEELAKYGSPKPFVTSEDNITLAQSLTPLVREYNAAKSLARAWTHGEPEPDRGHLEVMWPSPK